MPEVVSALADNPWVPVLAVGALWILCATVDSILKGRSREQTKREIAAYIAEGSMTPEEGERLIRAEPDSAKEA